MHRKFSGNKENGRGKVGSLGYKDNYINKQKVSE